MRWWALEVIMQASAGCITWCRCPSKSGICGPHTTKSAHKCSSFKSEGKEGCTKPSKSQCSWSCTTMHVFLFRTWGRTWHPNVLLDLLRPRTRAALSEAKRLSYTEHGEYQKDLALFDLVQFKLSWYCRIHCQILLMHIIIHYLPLIVNFPRGGFQSCNYSLLILYLLHLLIATLVVKHE